MIKAVLFDLDGTLVDTAPDFVVVLNAQLQAHGKKPIAEQRIRDTVSNGARALTKLAFGGEPGQPHFERMRQELLDRYENEVGKAALFFEGMNAALQVAERHSLPWGIVTNKPRLYTDLLLNRMNLSERCVVSVCPDEVSISKPHPEGLFLAANTLQCAPEHCLYVGDHERDIEAGRAAGMRTVAARYGYIGDKDSVSAWQADHIIDHPADWLPLTGIRP